MRGWCSGTKAVHASRPQWCGLVSRHPPPASSNTRFCRGYEYSRVFEHGLRSLCTSVSGESAFAEVEVPDIEGDIRFYQEDLGAVFSDEGVPLSFGDSKGVADSLKEGFVVLDQSHWGRIKVSGEGALDFLHGQSTNDFKGLAPGAGCQTVFVTATGRTIDLATCYVTKMGAIVVVSPGVSNSILERLEKYVFPGDKVELMDVRSSCTLMSVWGPKSDSLVDELGMRELSSQKQCSFLPMKFKDNLVMVARGSAIGMDGYSFLVDDSVAGDLYAMLISKGGVPIGEEEWERCRVQAGRLLPGKEMTNDVNALEAGLFNSISLNKGCYIGQETLAKVYGKRAIKQELWGIAVSGPVTVGDSITGSGEKRLGKVTSAVKTISGDYFALGYLRCRAGGGHVDLEGMEVDVDGVKGVVTPIDFVARDFVDSKSIPEGMRNGTPKEDVEPIVDDVVDDGKQERLKAMEAKLAEFLAQQGKEKK